MFTLVQTPLLPLSFSVSATAEQIDKAKEVVKKLTFNYQSDAFENPGELVKAVIVCIERNIIMHYVKL